MKSFKKTAAYTLVIFGSLIFSVSEVIAGNGNGNEPPIGEEKGSGSSFCKAVPLFCSIAILNGNGNGNEPPEKD